MSCLTSKDGALTICGDFGRGGYCVWRTTGRVWKWCVCWQGSSLWYDPTPEKFFKTRQAAQAWCRKQTRSYFTKAQLSEFIDQLMKERFPE